MASYTGKSFPDINEDLLSTRRMQSDIESLFFRRRLNDHH
jgi:hypothetical protein